MIGNDDVGCAGIVDVQHQHHRRRLRTVVDQLVAHSDFQEKSPWPGDLGAGIAGNPATSELPVEPPSTLLGLPPYKSRVPPAIPSSCARLQAGRSIGGRQFCLLASFEVTADLDVHSDIVRR
jgi:hypothetical protein